MDAESLPVPDGPDPIESDEPDVLRTEILRLRDSVLATGSRHELLTDRIRELETVVESLDDINRSLRTDLARYTESRMLRAATSISRPIRRLSTRAARA